MIPNVQAAMVVDRLDAACKDDAIAFWPNNAISCDVFFGNIPLLKKQLSPVVIMGKQAHSEKNALHTSIDRLIIVYPLSFSNDFSGAVVLEVAAKSSQQTVLLQMLKWGQSWLQLLLKKTEKTADQNDEIKYATVKANEENPSIQSSVPERYLSIIQAVLSCSENQQALMILVNSISDRWQFERVSLGIIKRNNIDVKALSHSAYFDSRSNLIVTMQQAMLEVQNKPEGIYVVNDRTAEYSQYLGHKNLLKGREDYVVISIPLQHNDHPVAVLLCELKGTGDATHKLAQQYLDELNILSGLLGPLVVLHQQSNQSIPAQIKARSHSRLSNLKQGRYGKLPLIGGLICTLLLISVIKIDFRVSSEAVLEGSIQRAVVAPFDGYVDNAFSRAGDQVKAGDVLAQLDDQPLQLEKLGWLSKKEEYQKQYRQELAGLNHAQARIIKAQIAQADIHIAQANSRLQRSRLVAPLTGIIIEGDLSRSLGAPVEQGQVLFEVSPLDDYRVVLKIHERDIGYLQNGQTGSLMLTAYPNESIPLTIEQVAIVYEQEGDSTWYRTEASIPYELLPSIMLLRPGMEGLGKIEVGQKSLAWIGFHRLSDWLTLRLWSWTP